MGVSAPLVINEEGSCTSSSPTAKRLHLVAKPNPGTTRLKHRRRSILLAKRPRLRRSILRRINANQRLHTKHHGTILHQRIQWSHSNSNRNAHTYTITNSNANTISRLQYQHLIQRLHRHPTQQQHQHRNHLNKQYQS